MNLYSWIDNRASEFRFALRMIRKTPGVTAVAVLSLGLGIGANTAIFSLIDTLMLKQLPVESPQELHLVASNPARRRTSWNYPDYVAFRDHNRSFTGLAAGSLINQPLGMEVEGSGPGTATELAHAVMVSGNYFEVLGIVSAIGRVFTPEEDRVPGAAPYAVLSHDFWQRRFHSDPQVIGLNIRLNSHPFTIVGVARRGFRGTDVAASPDLFIPMMMRSEVTGDPFTRWNNRHYWWMQILGRLKPGVAPKAAESELYALFRGQEEAERSTASEGTSVSQAQPIVLIPASRGYSNLRNQMEKPLLVLMAVVALVLLIACANVASLMLARGAARQREIAVRLAIGATRARLTGQLLVESIVIAILGGAAGFLFAYAGVKALLEFVPQQGIGLVTIHASLDLRLLGFTCAVSLFTGVLFGMAPALQSTRPDLLPALKEEVPGAAGVSPHRMRSALVVAQVALSLLLLIGAGLFIRSLGRLRDIDPGLRADNTWLIRVDPNRSGYKGQRLRDFYERLRAQSEHLPGVQSLSLATITPLTGMRWNGDFAVEGYQWQPGDVKYVDMNSVGPGYFGTLGIPILLGRDFRDTDNPPYTPDPPETLAAGLQAAEPPGPRVVIISESMAKQFFSGRNPLGMHLCLEEEYTAERAYEVIGVVKDVRYFDLREAPQPMVYLPLWRGIMGSRMLCIRTTGEMPAIVEAVRRQVYAIDPGIPVLGSVTMKQQISNNIIESRIVATLSGFFGILALLLAGIGIYGMLSFAVTRRTREIGIRMALGAQREAVLWLVLRDAGLLVLAGAAMGIPAALASGRLVKAFLYGISPQDPLTIVLGSIVLAGAAALACLIPARRATRVDPMVALRNE